MIKVDLRLFFISWLSFTTVSEPEFESVRRWYKEETKNSFKFFFLPEIVFYRTCTWFKKDLLNSLVHTKTSSKLSILAILFVAFYSKLLPLVTQRCCSDLCSIKYVPKPNPLPPSLAVTAYYSYCSNCV